MQQKMPVCNHL